MRRLGWAAVVAIGMTGLASPAIGAGYKVEIVRTKFGVPHVTAADYGSLGYGQAYAFAQDNLCLLADKIVTVRGERSKHFGPDAANVVSFQDVKNLESDFFFRGHIDITALRASFAAASADYQALVTGYVAGFNRFLKDTPVEKLPAACGGKPWLGPISIDDMLRLNEERMIQASGGAWLRQTNAAAPPKAAAPGGLAEIGLPAETTEFGLGSNGWAFGAEATANKSGLLLGNPHFPWETTNRFYELHLTIPGKLDVMGVTIAGAPGLSIGFNKDVAWTHTVSSDQHFTLHELKLDPADPTAYLVDGEKRRMEKRSVTVDTSTGPQSRAYYLTHYGSVVVMPQAGLNWTASAAYALKDANRSNIRSGDTWMGITRARSVGEIRQVITRTLGIPWVNTIAADRHGDALYADITATPNISAEKLKTCAPGPAAAALAATARIYILDGSRSACDWDLVAGTPTPGLTPGEAMPAMVTRDYVQNSNDSYWLSNAKAPFPAFSPIIGPVDNVQNLRTRAGLRGIAEIRAAGAFDPAKIRTWLFDNRNHAAELFLDDALKSCPGTGVAASGKTVDLTAACAVLARWDRKTDVESRGAHLFYEFWRAAEKAPGLYATPFDPKDPVNTPRGLKTDEATAAKLRGALATAIEVLEAQKMALDARWGDVHFAVRGDQKIPVHGGEGGQGVLNAQQSRFNAAAGGYVPYHGSSYIQVVTFDAKGPVADAVLSYSQSTDPASPHYGDQTWLYAKEGWHRLPFHKADIAAEALGPPLRLSE